jgi:uncharacterized protein YndB with AHSA1/START domain
MKIQKTIEINAPPEVIWPYFTEPEKVLRWYSTFMKFEYITDQRSGVGTAYYIEEKAAGPLMKMNFKATEWDEGRKIAFQMTTGSGVRSYKQAWRLDPTPSGTRFTFDEEIELPFGIIGKLISPLAQRMSEAAVNKMQLTLKDLAEK